MGYLDKELGIKTVKSLIKYVKNHFKDRGHEFDIDGVKVANSIRVFWAMNSSLHTYDIRGSVIYVMTTNDLDDLIKAIYDTIPPNERNYEPIK